MPHEGFPERAMVFGRSRHLVGVLSTPAGGSPSPPGVLFINAGIIHRVGASRIYVRLARALARRGALTLRFDLSGIGDSSQPDSQFGGSRTEIAQRDVDEALSLLQSEGAGPLIVAGLCSGADDSLAAITRSSSVTGAVLLDPFAFPTRRYYTEYYGPRLLRPSSWWGVITGKSKAAGTLSGTLKLKMTSWQRTSEPADFGDSASPTRSDYLRSIEALAARGAHLLYLFAGGLPQRYGYQDQLFDAFPRSDLRKWVELEYLPDAGHTFRSERMQQQLEERVLHWYDSHYRSAKSAQAPTR